MAGLTASTPTARGGKATISSCFYLLVKYAEVTPKSFICKGDSGTTEFKLSELTAAPAANFELIDVWDFGPCGRRPTSIAATRTIARSGSTR